MIAPCQLYSQFTTLSVNFTLAIFSKLPHLSLNLSLKLETHHILTLNLTHLTYKHKRFRWALVQFYFSQNNTLKSKNSETAL